MNLHKKVCLSGLVAVCLLFFSIGSLFAGASEIVIKRTIIPKTFSVSIGINRYETTKLRFPVHDARLVAKALKETVSSDESVTLIIDEEATKENLIRVLSRLVREISDSDQVLIFFSGMSHYVSTDRDVRFLMYGSGLGRPEQSFSLLEDLLPLFSTEQRVILIADGCSIGDAMLGRVAAEYPNFCVLSSTKHDELASDNSPFAKELASALLRGVPDLDGDRLTSLDELYVYLYPKIVKSSLHSGHVQHPSLGGLRTHRTYLIPSFTPPAGEKVGLDNGVLKEMAVWKQFTINGKDKQFEVRIDVKDLVLPKEAIQTLGPGLNLLQSGKRSLLLWFENKQLRAFLEPYVESHAVIVAIDQYDSNLTSVRPLRGMRRRASELVTVLTKLGFDSSNIHELYDEEATSTNIESLLREFWKGGRYASADRLVVYLGGHGLVEGEQALFVTYDYQPARPTLTSVPLFELTGRHSRNITTNHVLFAIDSCFSGLALTLAGAVEDEASDEFRRLAVMRSELTERARNLIVAGTDRQEALWENGGIFTQALVKALSGQADLDNDGLIVFPELCAYIRAEVTVRASRTGFRQDPLGQRLTSYGTGAIVFPKIRTSTIK